MVRFPTNQLLESINKIIIFLKNVQRKNGAFNDFQLITGESTSWVTSFVGIALVDLLEKLKNNETPSTRANIKDIYNIISLAKNFVLGSETLLGAWGYNEKILPDADSTAICLRFLLKAGVSFDNPSIQRGFILLNNSQVNAGGVATYQKSLIEKIGKIDLYSGWVEPHLSVTAAAMKSWLLAIESIANKETKSTTIISQSDILNSINKANKYIRLKRQSSGIWYDYWWLGPYYSTGVVTELGNEMKDIFLDGKILKYFLELQNDDGGYGCIKDKSDAFATAWSLKIYLSILKELRKNRKSINDEIKNSIYKALAWLYDAQKEDGSFEPGAFMRIPSPNLRVDEIESDSIKGRISLDIKSIFTSATVLRVLLACVEYVKE